MNPTRSIVLASFETILLRTPTKKRELRTIKKPSQRRFWILGAGAGLLLYHSYGVLTGVYSDLTIVPSDIALKIGGLELLLGLVLVPVFLAKSFVWYHDRGVRQKHVYDDPGIIE
jgi:hypothetical protein